MARMRKKSMYSDDLLPIKGFRGRTQLEKLYTMTLYELMMSIPARAPLNYALKGEVGLFSKWLAARELRNLHKKNKAGDKSAILIGLFLCVANDLAIPRWCAEGFFTAIGDVLDFKAKSWDDVFGRPHPKGAHLDALRKRNEYEIEVRLRIQELKEANPEIAIDASLFERVGKELGIGGKTLTEEYYYSKKKTPRKKSRNT